MTLIAGRLALRDVMAHLAIRRPVFHSEADFQFAFAQSVAALNDSIGIRLEVPQRDPQRAYTDLVCRAGHDVSLIEFKYVTRFWAGTDGCTDERFELRDHGALDLARLHFVHDATRLESWVAQQIGTNGFAVLLTNDNRLWELYDPAGATRDQQFRLHEGRILAGSLSWGTPERPFEANNRVLRSTYLAHWQDFSRRDSGPGGTFRWLGWTIAPELQARRRTSDPSRRSHP